MSDAAKQTGSAGADVHGRIRAESERLKAAAVFGFHQPQDVPELSALLNAGFDAVAQAVPKRFDYEGRAYWIRCRLAVQLDIYEEPGDRSPMARGAIASAKDCGYVGS